MERPYAWGRPIIQKVIGSRGNYETMAQQSALSLFSSLRDFKHGDDREALPDLTTTVNTDCRFGG